MRYPASEKAEIIPLIEQSHLPAKRTLAKLGIPRATFYRDGQRRARFTYCELERTGTHRGLPDSFPSHDRSPAAMEASGMDFVQIFGLSSRYHLSVDNEADRLPGPGREQVTDGDHGNQKPSPSWPDSNPPA